jgi:hypothetical protein
MHKVYDDYGELWDIDTYCDLCNDCIFKNECILIMAIASDMVELTSTQPLEACNFYKQNTWFNKLIHRRL